MTEQKPEPKPEEKKNDDKTLFGLINAAASMLEGVTAPAKPEYKRPERPAPSPRQAAKTAAEEAKTKRHTDRHAIIEAAAIQLLLDLRSKGLVESDESISIKLETDVEHQFVTLNTKFTTS
ncbi:hypothetical protein PBI_MIMI_154 [Arthrobacter phage Mimi]|nr:hypothetical protein PBI_MIMI_234 [Arthrobacter phage Mimi]